MPPKRKQTEDTSGGEPQKVCRVRFLLPPLSDSISQKTRSDATGVSAEPRSKLHETEFLKMLEVKKTALLGYAIMSFATLNDLGRGLNIELQKFNPRVATPAQINALRTAIGGDPNDPTKEPICLNRFSPEHAMFLLVKRQYIDLTSLSKDPFSSEFQQVRWKTEARNSSTTDVAYLINGNTRRELCLGLGGDAIAKLDVIKEKLQKSKGAEYQQLLKERLDITIEVRMKTSWIVAFYDHGMCVIFVFHRLIQPILRIH